MGRLRIQDCVSRAFDPLLKAAGRDDLAPRLKVIPPPKDERAAQFAKFGAMKGGEFSPLFLPNGGFFFPFSIDDTQCYAFSSFLDEIDLSRTLSGWLSENDAIIESVDQATFLFLAYHASNYYSLRPEFQSSRVANEIIGLAEFDKYDGHDVDDLIGYFRPTYVVSVPIDSVLSAMDPYVIATELLALIPGLRSPIIDNEFSQAVHSLLATPSIRSENLFLSLTATRWRYAYLELFRIIESTLYVPWLLDLNAALGSGRDLPELYKALRESLDWREIKGRSLERVFQGISSDYAFDARERSISVFNDIFSSEVTGTGRGAVARRIFKIRNQLVHPEDFTDGSLLNVSEAEFRDLAVYLCAAAGRIYGSYDAYLRSPQVS